MSKPLAGISGMEASIIVTYRCANRCHMCGIWKYPTKEEEEFRPSLLEKLPKLKFCNITGGEPFLREDIGEIVNILRKKAKRLVISTNGYFTDRILDLAKKYRRIGIRISLEGLPAVNDELRGVRDSFDHGLRTLLGLKKMGLKDIGFGITVSDKNAKNMLELFQLAKAMKVEFATAVVHNSYYFHKYDNRIENKEKLISCFNQLRDELLKTWKIKNWFRAYFNQGLINYIQGKPRLLPCPAGQNLFFLDPFGEVRPCNGMEESIWFDSFGNLHEKSFRDIWHSDKAEEIREKIIHCPKFCWMIGTAGPAMKKHIRKPVYWIIRNKLIRRVK
jgi:MoaA/NifB/PqqE/SkfB family radical SAM enzyme